MRRISLTVIRGFCMGAADVVPGVSGGTVALVLGIYQHLVESIRNGSSAIGRVLKGDLKGSAEKLREVDWLFLLPLLAGILLAVVSLAGVIEHQLETNPQAMGGLFMGLVAGSVVVAWALLRERDPQRIAVMLVAAVGVFLLLGLRTETTAVEDAAGEFAGQVSNPALWAFFGAGALAVCAMILPGISGSFILVMIGMYGPVLGAVNERDLLAVTAVALGCVVGLGLFSQVLHWALSEHYNTVMAGLIGLMVGSLRVLWPWPGGVESTELAAPSDPVASPIILAVVGFVVVIGIDQISKRVGGPSTEDEVDEIRSV